MDRNKSEVGRLFQMNRAANRKERQPVEEEEHISGSSNGCMYVCQQGRQRDMSMRWWWEYELDYRERTIMDACQ